MPNGSIIYLSGANDRTEIDKFRGLPITLCYIDECQSFRPYIESLVDDVISKALFDYNGTLVLIGTPGPIPAGYFYDCAHSEQWSHHAWTMFQNPHLEKKSGKSVHDLLQRELDRKGVTVEDPTIQRECFGKWVTDQDALVFKYDHRRNHFDELPNQHDWSYVIGIDLGFDDADAIAVLGWAKHKKEAYLVEELISTKQGITELSSQIAQLLKKYGEDRVLQCSADTGGLGKKIVEEIRKRYSLPVVATEKARKAEHIEILNDALRTKRFHAKKTSRFAQDTALIEWDHEKSTPERLVISDAYHSDICDAVLYAYRTALHWLEEPAEVIHKPGTLDWQRKQAEEMENTIIKSLEPEEDQWGDMSMGWE